MAIPDYIRVEAQKELARRYLYDYCQLKYPRHYTEDRTILKDVCEQVQAFSEQNEKRFLIVNMPPRHYKSFTAGNFVEWRFGNDPTRKVMTGSYNEELSTTFATKVRDTIEEEPSEGVLVYRDIFPETRVKYGQAAMKKWALEGSGQASYLATSPTGTATGFGANDIVIDDIIKNATEAFSELVLEKHWNWFTNTMLSRTEGDDWKVYVFMTRWALGDLAGRIVEAYADQVQVITYTAVQEDGSMLSDSILNRSSYELKTQEMAREIVEANYNQKPIDVQGRLYSAFAEWENLPKGIVKKWNFTDTADTGSDYLASLNYVVQDDLVYITDLYFSDEPMEVTESEVARLLDEDAVDEAEFESNNGGRGFARNVETKLRERGNKRCVVKWQSQSSNKEARILASSAWVNKHVLMPLNWKRRYPEFHANVMSYQRKGKNAHDDGPDVLASIYERVAIPQRKESRVYVI